MRRPGKPNEPEEPMLFDLPLSAPGSDDEPDEPPMRPQRSTSEPRRPAPMPERSHETTRTARPGPVPVVAPPVAAVPGEAPGARSEFAGPGRRIAAGLADLVVHAAVVVLALLGCRGLGVQPDLLRQIPAFGALLVSFSFLYRVLPLAFWGHTPGMAWAAITSRNRDGEPLTFDQTVRRWLGGLLTFALAGLPLLVAPGGRTLTDWISGSATYPFDDEDEG
jgi:uncharacterized RDD family membrane protein YckC